MHATLCYVSLSTHSMKQVLISLLCIIFLFSCKKETPTNSDYAGTWEIERSQSIVGTIIYPPGNGQVIRLTASSSYESINADTLVYRGNFYLEKKQDCDGETKHMMFKTSESPTEFRIYKEGDKLVLSTSACYSDGGIGWYRRTD